MHKITVEDAKEQLHSLIQDAMKGEEVIIVKNDTPLVKLAPIKGKKATRKFGNAKGLVEITDGFDAPLEDFAEYM